jgi:hypothetical protein
MDRGRNYDDVRQVVEQERYIALIQHRRRRGEPIIEACPVPGETRFPAADGALSASSAGLLTAAICASAGANKAENSSAFLQFACAHIRNWNGNLWINIKVQPD